MKDPFHPGMSDEEIAAVVKSHTRIMTLTLSKLQFLPEEHKAEIRAAFVEEGLMDCLEAGHSCQTILARRMAQKFYNIPIAVTVFEGKCYGAYIGNYEPYDLPAYDPMIATLAIQMGLFNDTKIGEINGKRVTWYLNRRHDTE